MKPQLNKVIAHIDMDCFFCACEIKRYPNLKGKPVIVGSTGKRGVVSASNYEARKFGVFSATPISRARALCSHGIFLPVDFHYYRDESKKIMSQFQNITNDICQVSVDEAYLDLTTYSKQFQSISDMAIQIQKTIYKKTNMTCSIGISNSKIVSKIASDHKKPVGITIVYNNKKFLKDLPIETIPGIGKVAKTHYNANNIYKIGDLLTVNRFVILEKFGMHGIKNLELAEGNDKTGIHHIPKSKSVSRENTFRDDKSDKVEIENHLTKLSSRVHKDLCNKTFKSISIKVRYSDFKTITRDITLQNESKSLTTIIEQAITLFQKCFQPGEKIRLIGVKLSKLMEQTTRQVTLNSFAY